ncbi:DUF4968 domain-containing protein, partial [Carboxylicivirga sp. A043]
MNRLRSGIKSFGALLVVGLVLFSCSQTGYVRSADGIIIHPSDVAADGAKTIKLQVVSDEIVRVTATPKAAIDDRESLIIVKEFDNKVKYDVVEQDDELHLKTAKLLVKASLKTGEVAFYDLEGNPLLKEEQGSHKKFTPIEVDGYDGYTFEQVFESPEDEAFYGLGQHQSDEWNYKGKNEELYQYNTKVSVPFVVSNKNYGILWDNYSYSRFGNS